MPGEELCPLRPTGHSAGSLYSLGLSLLKSWGRGGAPKKTYRVSRCSEFVEFHQNESHQRCEGVTSFKELPLPAATPAYHPFTPDRGAAAVGIQAAAMGMPALSDAKPP